jgi:glutamyl-tRNA synthetase
MTRSPRGRYAPSPTGAIHLGNASTALVAWLAARSRGGAFVMRMEDLDRPRVRPGAAERILADLEWLGLDWDEGPDRAGPHAPYEQSKRQPLYETAFATLRERDCVYRCFCSRRDVAGAASAPQTPGDEVHYPGTCRGLDPAEIAEKIARGARPCWRFRVDGNADTAFLDLAFGRQESAAIGDFVVWRADSTPAYQLAVVVDDAAMAIDEVVRGRDLLASTARQILLYRALDLASPAFGHVPLLMGPDGIRLSKRHEGVTLAELRDAGVSAERIVGFLASELGICPDPRPLRPASLVGGFDFSRIADRDIVLLPGILPVRP